MGETDDEGRSMPYAAEIFIRLSALFLNCREEWGSVTVFEKSR